MRKRGLSSRSRVDHARNPEPIRSIKLVPESVQETRDLAIPYAAQLGSGSELNSINPLNIGLDLELAFTSELVRHHTILLISEGTHS